MKVRAKVIVKKIESVADPEGKAIHEALLRLRYRGVSDVRSGKLFLVDINADTLEKAKEDIEAIARDVLSNPIIEVFSYDLEALK